MQVSLKPIYMNGNPLFYQGPTIHERVYLPISPQQPEWLDSHYGSGLIRRTVNAPKDFLPFTPILGPYHDDSLSFGGYPGANFLMRSPK